MSDFAENVFRRFAEQIQQPMILVKGEFYKLIDYIDESDISQEIIAILDLIVLILKN